MVPLKRAHSAPSLNLGYRWYKFNGCAPEISLNLLLQIRIYDHLHYSIINRFFLGGEGRGYGRFQGILAFLSIPPIFACGVGMLSFSPGRISVFSKVQK